MGRNKLQVFHVKGVPIGVFTRDDVTGDDSLLETERSSQGRTLREKEVTRIGFKKDFRQKGKQTGSDSKKSSGVNRKWGDLTPNRTKHMVVKEHNGNIPLSLKYELSSLSKEKNQGHPVHGNPTGEIQENVNPVQAQASNHQGSYSQSESLPDINYQLVNYPRQGNTNENLPKGNDQRGYGLVAGGYTQGRDSSGSYQVMQFPGRNNNGGQGVGIQGENDQRGSYSSVGFISEDGAKNDYQLVQVQRGGTQGVGSANQNYLQNEYQTGSYSSGYLPEGGAKGVKYQLAPLPGNGYQGGQVQGYDIQRGGSVNQNYLQSNDQRGRYSGGYLSQEDANDMKYHILLLPGKDNQGGQLQELGDQGEGNANDIYPEPKCNNVFQL